MNRFKFWYCVEDNPYTYPFEETLVVSADSEHMAIEIAFDSIHNDFPEIFPYIVGYYVEEVKQQ